MAAENIHNMQLKLHKLIYFGHLAAEEPNCKHNIDILSLYEVVSCYKAVAYLHIQQIWSDISIHFESSFCPPYKCKSNILSLLAPVLVSTNSWGK